MILQENEADCQLGTSVAVNHGLHVYMYVTPILCFFSSHAAANWLLHSPIRVIETIFHLLHCLSSKYGIYIFFLRWSSASSACFVFDLLPPVLLRAYTINLLFSLFRSLMFSELMCHCKMKEHQTQSDSDTSQLTFGFQIQFQHNDVVCSGLWATEQCSWLTG